MAHAMQSKNSENEKSVLRQAMTAVSNSLPGKAAKFAIGIVGKALTSDTFFNWLGHGATELANMVLHGHAAPVYSRAGTPDVSVYGPPETDQQVAAISSKETSIAPGSADIVSKYTPKQQVPQLDEQSVKPTHDAPHTATLGIVEQHMQDLKALPQVQAQDQEVSR